MSISNIVCLGFGSWSNVNQLPTLGFGDYLTDRPMSGVVGASVSLVSSTESVTIILGGPSESIVGEVVTP